MIAQLGRRALLRTGLAAAAGPALRGLAFAAPEGAPEGAPLLILVFLRGGMDGLNFLSPADDAAFVAMRNADLRVRAEGPAAGHRLDASPAADFRLHREAAPLAAIWRERRMAIWPAAGLPEPTRSHFEAQAMMAAGQGSRREARAQRGWLGAWAEALSARLPPTPGPRTLAGQTLPPAELRGAPHAVALGTLAGGLALPGGPTGTAMLAALYATGTDPVSRAGREAITDMRFLDRALPRDAAGHIPPYAAANGADYGGAGNFGQALATIAQVARLQPGLVAAAADLGGWDTHEGQANRFTNQLRTLSRGLAALDRDLADLPRRWTMLVASEFGRRLRSNASGGTDHGRAGTILAFGRGGRLGGHFGAWPGLAPDQLEDGVDLRVAEDYRGVFRAVMADLAGSAVL